MFRLFLRLTRPVNGVSQARRFEAKRECKVLDVLLHLRCKSVEVSLCLSAIVMLVKEMMIIKSDGDIANDNLCGVLLSATCDSVINIVLQALCTRVILCAGDPQTQFLLAHMRSARMS